MVYVFVCVYIYIDIYIYIVVFKIIKYIIKLGSQFRMGSKSVGL
jgi:hypothetical protein